MNGPCEPGVASAKYLSAAMCDATAPFEDDQTKVSIVLSRLIRAALEESAADVENGGYYGDHNRRKKLAEVAGERAKTLRRLRDEFELAMAGAVLE